MNRPVREEPPQAIAPAAMQFSNGARGKFIVLEGGEGAGKSVQMANLRTMLPQGTIFTRDPGGVETGEDIRRMVLSKETRGIDAATELLLFMAARAQLIAELIAPALETGKTVVCDRFILSTIAYQVYGRQRNGYLPLVKSIFASISRDCIPDLTIFLDVSPEIGLARARARLEVPNRFDDESNSFHERVRDGYKTHLEEYGKAVIVDANKGVDEVWTEIKSAVQSVLH